MYTYYWLREDPGIVKHIVNVCMHDLIYRNTNIISIPETIIEWNKFPSTTVYISLVETYT